MSTKEERKAERERKRAERERAAAESRIARLGKNPLLAAAMAAFVTAAGLVVIPDPEPTPEPAQIEQTCSNIELAARLLESAAMADSDLIELNNNVGEVLLGAFQAGVCEFYEASPEDQP